MPRAQTTARPIEERELPARERAAEPDPGTGAIGAEDALRQSEERFRGAFDNAPIGMAIVATDGRWLMANEALCEMLGLSEEELSRKGYQDVTHPDDLESNTANARRLLEGAAGSYTMEKRYLRPDGRVVWAILSVSIVRDRSGEPLYFVSQVMDITERKLAEATLRERDTIMRAVASCAERLLGANEWRGVIDDVLRELGEAADVSRAYVFQAHEDDEGRMRMSQVNEWSAPGIQSQVDNPSLRDRVPDEVERRWIEDLRRGRVAHAHAHELPPKQRAFFEAQGIRSIVLVPVFTEGAWWGFLGFDECRAQRRWSAAEAEALRTAAGMLGAAIQRSRAGAARRDAEGRYRALVDTLPLVTYVDTLDDDMTPIYLSPQIEPLLGYSLEDWHADATLFGRILHPDDRAHAIEGEWAETDGPHRVEYRAMAKDGREVWFLDEHVIVRDEQGRRLYAQGYMLDITERRRIEEELRRATETLSAIFRASSAAIVGCDLNGDVTFWNPAAEWIFGWSAGEAVGERLPFVPQETEGDLKSFLGRVAQGESWANEEIRRARKDGTPVEISASSAPLRDGKGEIVGFVSIFLDVTDRKTLETQLLQSQRLEAVGRLAGGIAHDFNNLLTAVSGYGELLLDGLGPNDPLRRDAEEIKRAADVAAALVRQLLAFSRRQMVQPRVIDLNVVVDGAESLLRRLIGEDVVLETHLDPRLVAVRADPAQLEQIVVNLAVNARDAMPEGGRLSISTKPGLDGQTVCLTVTDTGCGMDEHTRLHAFEPFFTTKMPGKGTGLGLATVYGIVTQAGGTVEVATAPGAGATFSIELPALAPVTDPAPLAQQATGPGARSATVLLVEDEPVVRELAGRVLSSAGYTVLEAPGGAEALSLASGYAGPIDVLFTDVVMPGMGGRELAERLRHARPEICVLFTSGYTDDEVWKSDAGSETAFIGKPFTPAALRAKLAEILEEA